MNSDSNRRACHPKRWLRTASQAAREAGLNSGLLLSGLRHPAYIEVRWRVWHDLVEAGYSYSSIGRASGYDHTSVRYGHRRIKGLPVRISRWKPIVRDAAEFARRECSA